MKYLLLLCRDEETWERIGTTERRRIFEDTTRIANELTSRGQYLGGLPLHPSSSATCVRVRDARRLVTDGPFAETREQVGGYMLIDVPDLDEALRIAARVPLARVGAVEVRPVSEGEEAR